MSQYDTQSLHEFLTTTPEKGLRSILIDSQFTEVHFNMLMKVVRGCSEDEFCSHFDGQSFPKVRLNDKEAKLKEKFWGEAESCFLSRGVLFEKTNARPKVDKEAA